MKKYGYLLHDLVCIGLALVAALYFRHGFPLIQHPGKPEDFWPLLGVTTLVALVVFSLLRLHVRIWRYTSFAELGEILFAVLLVVALSNVCLFTISRLQMMPRSVPPIHWALAVLAMGGSRLMVRQWRGGVPHGLVAKPVASSKQHVLVVGACHTAELYLQFIKRIVPYAVVVEGFVDSNKQLAQRMFQKHKIWGTPAMLPQLVEQFLVHGIQIRHVILAQPLETLSQEDRAVLLAMETAGQVELVHFSRHMLQPAPSAVLPAHAATELAYASPSGWYMPVKRGMDVATAALLLVLLSPLMGLTALVVLADVGLPLLFWQQRPGLRGKPFRLYKFRTMRPARRRQDEDRLVHKSGDAMRTSAVGMLLRRLRLDELPQLFHILAGTMSFVGPRPLLPEDQPTDGHVRLSVRPGITGWAQIHGGDALSPEEKLVLDRWYIAHMGLWLDMRIMLRTLIVVLKEDRLPRYMLER